MKAKTEQARGQQRDRSGKKCISFWLPEETFFALRSKLLVKRLNVQAWGERIAERELSKAE